MCSTKWATPLRSADSWREPRVSQTPMLIDRTCDMRSVRIRRPLSRTSLTMGEFDKRDARCRPDMSVIARRRQRSDMVRLKVRQVVVMKRDNPSAADARHDLAEVERSALEEALAARGYERFRARQIFQWVYRRGIVDPARMSDLSRDLRTALTESFTLTTPALLHREKSVDGTEKFLLSLADGRNIESVFIPDTPSMTFCISTQVGCAMACAFCLTGRM